MARNKGKSVTFDAMVKFFIKTYNIPTRKDIEQIMARLERLEILIRNQGETAARNGKKNEKNTASGMTATAMVLEVISRQKDGADVKTIQQSTGFDSKKIRNIIYRMDKAGQIERIGRGRYITV